MKFKNWLILIVLFLFQGITAQIKDPVKFKYNINSLPNNEYEAVLTATIDKNWHIYSKDLPADSGIPTEMKLSSKEGIDLIGKVVEVGKKHDEFSEAFGAQIVYYSDLVQFKQKFKLKNGAKPATVSAEITMVPDTTIKLEGKDADKMMNLIDALEEHDDVQNVYANYEMDDEE